MKTDSPANRAQLAPLQTKQTRRQTTTKNKSNKSTTGCCANFFAARRCCGGSCGSGVGVCCGKASSFGGSQSGRRRMGPANVRPSIELKSTHCSVGMIFFKGIPCYVALVRQTVCPSGISLLSRLGNKLSFLYGRKAGKGKRRYGHWSKGSGLLFYMYPLMWGCEKQP